MADRTCDVPIAGEGELVAHSGFGSAGRFRCVVPIPRSPLRMPRSQVAALMESCPIRWDYSRNITCDSTV
jgi:hypothetical protein